MTKKKSKTKHPSLDIVESHGIELSGKKIVLCVAGSVAAYKSIELGRLLMRHGADVTCVASNAATKLIKPDYFKWATGNEVITKLTGNLEHIQLADYKQSDLIIVYPSTANTLGKLANGIDDTPISTVLTVGFGSKIPIVMALAMHEAMYENAAVLRNIKFLKNKIDFISPNMIE
ncbi:MAG: flavoprotein, partial [Nitrosopumilaceae archaeon]